jgi:hypothetical protein
LEAWRIRRDEGLERGGAAKDSMTSSCSSEGVSERKDGERGGEEREEEEKDKTSCTATVISMMGKTLLRLIMAKVLGVWMEEAGEWVSCSWDEVVLRDFMACNKSEINPWML